MTNEPAPAPPISFTAEERKEFDAVIAKYTAEGLDRAGAVVAVTGLLLKACATRHLTCTPALLRPFIDEIEGVDNARRPRGSGGGGGPGVGGRRRPRDEDDDDGDDRSPTKRPKVDYGALLRPADAAGDFLDALVSARVREVAKRVELFSLDPKEAIRAIVTSPHAPSFPPSLWKAVILDQYVDLDLVQANSFAVEPERPQEVFLGEHELEVRKPKVVSRITSVAQWNIVWWAYQQAVLFVFPGREMELREYAKHINNTFQSHHERFHLRVLNYDRAARVHIGQTRSLLLDDVVTLHELRHAHLADTGLHVVAFSGDKGLERGQRQQRDRARPTRKNGAAEICLNYNRGRCTLAHCRYRHVCTDCQGPHPAGECDKPARS
uniref:C3H1-type domain-containing protein n=1 Tax=Mycena chlorophos TaxID=658473 RepID=A0ABQ0L8W0_MYCCL|nr:predicted protein [Mycena chlorophos]